MELRYDYSTRIYEVKVKNRSLCYRVHISTAEFEKMVSLGVRYDRLNRFIDYWMKMIPAYNDTFTDVVFLGYKTKGKLVTFYYANKNNVVNEEESV